MGDKLNEDVHKFLKAIPKMKKRGINYNFICPLCNGDAVAYKSEYNGHMHAICKSCGFKLIE